MADRIVETQFRFVNDRQATSQLLRDNARIDDSLKDIDNTAVRVEDAYSDMEDAAKRAAKAQREASEAAIKAAKEQSELVGDVASRTSQLGGALSGLGAIGGQRLMIAADILDAVEAGQLLSAEFPALIQQMGITKSNVGLLAAGMAVLAGAFIILKDLTSDLAEGAQAAREAVNGQIDALKEFNIFIANATSDEVKARLLELDERRRINAQYEQDLLDLKLAVEKGLDISDQGVLQQLSEGAVRAADKFGVMEIGLKDIDKALSETRTELQATDAEFGLLVTAFTDGTVAANDARRAEEELTNARIANLERVKDLEIENAQLIRNASVKQIEDQLLAIDDQRAALEKLKTELGTIGGDEATQRIEQINDQLFVLGQREEALRTAVLPLVQAREDETQAIKNYEKAVSGINQIDPEVVRLYNEELKRQEQLLREGVSALGEGISYDAIVQGAQAIAQAEVDRLKIIADADAEILKVEAETADKRTALIERTNDQIEALEKQRDADLARNQEKLDNLKKQEEKFNEDQLQRLQDFQRDEARRKRDHEDALLDAAGRLDAVAILNEQKNYEKESKDAAKNFKTEQKRREKEFKEKLKEEEASLKKERQQIKRNFQDRERDLRDSLNRQLADLRTAQNQEIATIRSHQAQRLSELDNSLESELRKLTGFTEDEITVRDEHYVQMLDQLQTFVDDANQVVAGLTVGGGGGAVGSSIVPSTPGAVGQFPLSAGLRAPGGLASPFASPLALMPPVSRAFSTVNNTPQITNQFNGMDRLTPGQIRNVVKIVNDEMVRALTA